MNLKRNLNMRRFSWSHCMYERSYSWKVDIKLFMQDKFTGSVLLDALWLRNLFTPNVLLQIIKSGDTWWKNESGHCHSTYEVDVLATERQDYDGKNLTKYAASKSHLWNNCFLL